MSKVNNKSKEETLDQPDMNLLLETLQMMFTSMSDERDNPNELTHILSGLQGIYVGLSVSAPCILPRRRKHIIAVVDLLVTCISVVEYHLTSNVHEMDNPLLYTPTRMR